MSMCGNRTATAAGAFNVTCESNTAIVAANGQVMSNSIYWRVVGGTAMASPGSDVHRINLSGRACSGQRIAATAPTTAGLATRRVTASATLSVAAQPRGSMVYTASMYQTAPCRYHRALWCAADGTGRRRHILHPYGGRGRDPRCGCCGAANRRVVQRVRQFAGGRLHGGTDAQSVGGNLRSPAGLSDGTANNRIRLHGQGRTVPDAVLGTTVASRVRTAHRLVIRQQMRWRRSRAHGMARPPSDR